LQAWLNECWWLTALPQQFNRFRDSRPEITLYLIWKDGRAIFHKKHEQGVFVPREGIDNINRDDQSIDKFSDKLWLVRSYEQALQELSKDGSDEQTWERLSKKYGEITLPGDDQGKKFFYSDQLGLFLAL
jgi:CRISPR-associated endonuclease/helicase Cas3